MEYTIPGSAWKTYYETLSRISQKAADLMLEYIQSNGYKVDKAFIDYAYALASHYGDAAGALSSQMYDYCAEYWKKATSGEKAFRSMQFQPAEPAETATYGEVAKTMNGIAKSSVNPDSYANAVGRLVKRTAEDTTLKNAARDGAEFAWVPNGDTCSFCIMLASNGWQRMSKKAVEGNHAKHIHANCDCTYAVRFDGKGGVPGYDPERYKEIYDSAEGDTWEEKINSMRRENYAKNADKIREQKKAAYDERKALIGDLDNDILREKSRKQPGPDERAIVSEIVETEDFNKKISRLGEDEKATNVITYQARKTLRRRNGTNYEDLIFINPETGEAQAQRNYDAAGEVIPTERMKKSLMDNPGKFIGMHNHPHSNLPSYNDLSNARYYKYGIVLCHDGKVVKYTVRKEANLGMADIMLDGIQNKIKNNEEYSIDLELLKRIGVELEVI